jgi:hypothetical protein
VFKLLLGVGLLNPSVSIAKETNKYSVDCTLKQNHVASKTSSLHNLKCKSGLRSQSESENIIRKYDDNDFILKHDKYYEVMFDRVSLLYSGNFAFIVNKNVAENARHFLIRVGENFQDVYSVNDKELHVAINKCTKVEGVCGGNYAYYIDGLLSNKINNLVLSHREQSAVYREGNNYFLNTMFYFNEYNHNFDRLNKIKIDVDVLDSGYHSIFNTSYNVILGKDEGANKYSDLNYQLNDNILAITIKNKKANEWPATLYFSNGGAIEMFHLPKNNIRIKIPANKTYLAVSVNSSDGNHYYENKKEIFNLERVGNIYIKDIIE